MFPVVMQDLTVVVRGKTLLGPLDLTLEAGGITVVMGPNGAGKTTFLKTCHGVMRHSRGSINWQVPVDQAAQAQSFVFQSPIMLRRSVLENLTYPLRLQGMAKHKAIELAETWATRIGLAQHLTTPAPRLSGGEQQKLALARALITKPQCLFLDEPTASLDGSATKEIEALLQEAAANGTTLIMSTHNVGQAKRLGDHVLFLHQGKPILYAPASQVFDDSNKGGQNELVQRFLQGDIIE